MRPEAGGTLNRVPFWFLRHGETDWNVLSLAQGSIAIPLNANGLAQAHAAASLLPNRGIATIVSSPIARARITAEIAGEALGLPVQIDDDLRESAYGVMEGQPMALGTWFEDWVYGRATPLRAESFAAVQARVVAAVNRTTVLAPAVLIVAHGTVFRTLRGAMGLEPNVRMPNGVPILCTPGATPEALWELMLASLPATG